MSLGTPGFDSRYPERYRGLPQPLQANAGIIPRNRPGPLPSKYFPSCYHTQSLDTVTYTVERALLHRLTDTGRLHQVEQQTADGHKQGGCHGEWCPTPRECTGCCRNCGVAGWVSPYINGTHGAAPLSPPPMLPAPPHRGSYIRA
jgi:hypothetical protein